MRALSAATRRQLQWAKEAAATTEELAASLVRSAVSTFRVPSLRGQLVEVVEASELRKEIRKARKELEGKAVEW